MPDELERWAPRQAGRFDALRRDLPDLVEDEADRLADTTRRYAPRFTGRLRKSILARGLSVLAAPYAQLQSEGGIVRAERRGWLTIPVRRGYVPRPGWTTVRGRDGNQYVIRSGSFDLWAVRRRQVRIRGSRFLGRALSAHLAGADERVGRDIVEATRG